MFHCALSTILFTGMAFQESRPTTDDAREFLVQGCAAHLDRFPYVVTKFQLTQGYSNTPEDAVAGRALEDPEPVVYQGLWAWDRERGLFRQDRVYAPETIAKYSKPASGPGGFGSALYRTDFAIWNSNLEIQYRDNQYFHVATQGEFSLESWHPFNLGMGTTMPERVQAARAHGSTVTYAGDYELDGKKLPVLRFHATRGAAWQRDDFWIDPERGFTPVYIETFMSQHWGDKKPAMKVVVKEFKELGGDRWVPALYRSVNLTWTPIKFYELRLTEIELDRQPGPDPFDLHLRPGRDGNNRITKQWMIAETGRISLSFFGRDGRLLEDQSEVVLDPVAQVPQGVPVTIAETKHSSWWVLLWWSLVSVGLALVLRYLVMKRRAA